MLSSRIVVLFFLQTPKKQICQLRNLSLFCPLKISVLFHIKKTFTGLHVVNVGQS